MKDPVEVITELGRTNKLLRDLMIIQLSLAGVGQLQIRSIVGGDIVDVNRIAKVIRKYIDKKTNS